MPLGSGNLPTDGRCGDWTVPICPLHLNWPCHARSVLLAWRCCADRAQRRVTHDSAMGLRESRSCLIRRGYDDVFLPSRKADDSSEGSDAFIDL